MGFSIEAGHQEDDAGSFSTTLLLPARGLEMTDHACVMKPPQKPLGPAAHTQECLKVEALPTYLALPIFSIWLFTCIA